MMEACDGLLAFQPHAHHGGGAPAFIRPQAIPHRQQQVAAARKQRAESISGVEKVVLMSNVHMDLWTDARSGFLSTGDTSAKPPPKP